MFKKIVLLISLCAQACFGELLMVQTLTRHGERAPDKIVTKVTCSPIWPSVKSIKKDFGAPPGRLTPLGVEKMKQVGQYVKQKYIYDEEFVSPNYQKHMEDWDFIARQGYRQQRSLVGITLGIFENEPVPIAVSPRRDDSVLGGPAPACGAYTAPMIEKWYKTKGWDMMKGFLDDVIRPVEKICNISLEGNPVNAKPGGPNPHAYCGDVSDTLDSAFAVGVKLPKSVTPELHDRLTRLAFMMQEGSHYEDPQGATMFVGDFAEALLSGFEAWNNIPEGKKRPKKTPKMRLYSCSRELLYGLEHMFGWEVEIPGQPVGRVLSGSTFIWELHRINDVLHPKESGLVVRAFHWKPGMKNRVPLQKEMSLKSFRKVYEDYIAKHGGSWDKICDFKTFNPQHNHHDADFVNPLVTVGHEQVKTKKEKEMEKEMLTTTSSMTTVETVSGSGFFDHLVSVMYILLIGTLLIIMIPRVKNYFTNRYERIP